LLQQKSSSPMRPQRPASAPVHRTQHPSGERLLDLKVLLKDESHPELAAWFCGLSVVNRARARWVFIEPEGLPYPRQRARRELLEITHLDELDLVGPAQDEGVERHNKCQWAPAIKGEPLQAWKQFALRTTNQEFQKVPEPDPFFSRSVWLRMMRKSHGGLLRPGGLDTIESWSENSTQRQRAALSELLWSFADHLTSRRGRSETKISYGWPGQGDKAAIFLNDPRGTLGRPSSAPIAHAVQRNFERKKRMESEAEVALARRSKEERMARPKRAAHEKPQVDTLMSTIPFKWPGTDIIPLETASQAQMRTVKPAGLLEAIELNQPSRAANPAATQTGGRHAGERPWHGSAQYGKFFPAANKSFQPLNQMRRKHDIPGHDRLKKYVI